MCELCDYLSGCDVFATRYSSAVSVSRLAHWLPPKSDTVATQLFGGARDYFMQRGLTKAMATQVSITLFFSANERPV